MRWPLTTEQRFWSCVTIAGPDDCWPWDREGSDGYGEFYVEGRLERTHRYSWFLKNGPIPAGKCILHSCDNRPCCNPGHLFCGTKKDNFDDMVAKGRRVVAKGELWQTAHAGKTTKGEKNRHAKITAADVLIIRRDAAGLGASTKIIADQFNLTPNSVRDIVNRVKWSHVP